MTLPDRPDQVAAEAAVARLLRMALLEIRIANAPRQPEQDQETLAQYRRRSWAIADLCHNLPGFLHPDRRHRIAEGIECMWQTASAPSQQWIREQWDAIGFD